MLAFEGINGTVAGTRKGIDAALAAVRALPGCTDFEHKESFASHMPFLRMKVKLKKEIVTMGVPDIDPTESVGTYVEPDAWNDVGWAERGLFELRAAVEARRAQRPSARHVRQTAQLCVLQRRLAPCLLCGRGRGPEHEPRCRFPDHPWL